MQGNFGDKIKIHTEIKSVFVFSGQGAQAVEMGRDLFDKSSAAKIIFQKADAALGWSVSDLCFNGPEAKLTESKFCQPAIYTMSIACLAAFKEKFSEIKPLAVAGLSLGEFAALYAAEVFTFEDGLRLVARRGELMDEACRKYKGSMASILAGDPLVIAEVCGETGIDIANYNCPGQIVISGASEKVETAVSKLKEKGVKKIIPLKVAGAFHSRLMIEAGEKLGAVLEKIPMKNPSVPAAQNFTGEISCDVGEIRRNLVSQVAGSVQWEKCVKTILGFGADSFIEFGPGNVLTGLMKRISAETKLFNVNSSESLNK